LVRGVSTEKRERLELWVYLALALGLTSVEVWVLGALHTSGIYQSTVKGDL